MTDHNMRILVVGDSGAAARAVAEAVVRDALHNVAFSTVPRPICASWWKTIDAVATRAATTGRIGRPDRGGLGPSAVDAFLGSASFLRGRLITTLMGSS